MVMTGVVREAFAQHTNWFDPRQYLGGARTALQQM
jgi:fructose-bisphosphate aldolase class II